EAFFCFYAGIQLLKKYSAGLKKLFLGSKRRQTSSNKISIDKVTDTSNIWKKIPGKGCFPRTIRPCNNPAYRLHFRSISRFSAVIGPPLAGIAAEMPLLQSIR